MKKNGFIATSLIYTFFLMFVTLFLTIIADYLQNKILLDTTEKGIKDELNSVIGIRDFEVGNAVSFVENCDVTSARLYIIAKIDYNSSKLILYSYDLSDNVNGALTKSNVDDDFSGGGYDNATYYNKILYTFSPSSIADGEEISYYLGEDSFGNKYSVSKKVDNNCISDDKYTTSIGCVKKSQIGTKYRERIEKIISGNVPKCNLDTEDGTLYIKE